MKGQSKGNKRDPCSNESVLYFDCLDAGILVLRAYYSFARCYHWGKLVKSYTQSLKDFLYMIKESSRWWVAWGGREGIYVYTELMHFIVQQKLT